MESVEKENVTHVAKDGDEISSTELEQESCLKKKKKPRRVSFAEITSVHVFDRDEDYETPPDNKPNTVEERVRTLPGGSPRPSLKLLQDEDVDDHLQSTPTSGLQENESEQFVHEADTPGSMSDRGTPGEEGEFFGPVSLWHIAPGMSARSPVTDDITLDCTTFSLQFGKLMVPGKECANAMEEVKTPATEIEGRTPATEDFKTPVGGTRGPSQGNSMVLTKPKQPISRQLVCDDDTLGNVEGMEDMRMTEEKQFKFDFANMHPDLDSLLAQKISELKPTIGTLPAKNSKDAKFMLDEEVKQSGIEIASKNGKNTIGIFSAKTDEDTKLGPVKRATIEMLSTENNKDTKLIPCGEMNLPTSEIASETNKNTSGTLLVNNNEDIKLTPDEVKHQQRELGLISPAQRIKLKSCADEVHGPSIDINTTRHYNDTKATLHTEIRQSSIESATAKQSNDTKVMSVDDSSFIQFEGEQKQKQKEMFWDAERGIEPKDPVNVELRGSTFETMSGNNQNKGSSKIDLELMAKHSYGLIESSLEHDAYSSHANSENQGNSKRQNQKGSLLIQRMNDEGIGLKGTGKNLLSNKYEDSSVKQSGSVELQEIRACYTPLKAIHSATKQPGSAKLQEMHAHFTPTKADGSIVKQNLFSNKYEVSAVKQSGSAELQEIRTCHTPLKAVHSASKQSGSVKLKDIRAQFTPTKGEGSVVKQSSSVELQEASACYTPLKAGDFVAKQSGSGKLQEICAHFTPTKAEGSVVKQSGSVKLYAHSDTRAMTEEEASSLVVKQSSSVELQEVPACYTPLKADHFVAKQSGSGKLQEICAHFTPTKAEGSVAKQFGSVKLYAHSDTRALTEEEASSLVVKQSSSVELQEVPACYTPLKADHFVAKQSGSGKLQEICAHVTPTKAEASVVKQSGSVKLYAHSDTRAMTEEEARSLVVKQSSSVELQEVPACYTPLKADHFVAKQSGSGKLQEICAHFTPTKAEGSVAKQSGSVKLYAHSDTREITEEEASSLVPLDMKTKIDHGNNMLFLSQREWSSTHENTTDSQRYQKHQISDCLTDHIPKELKIYQHPPVDNCLKTNEFLHDPEKTLSSPVFDGKGCHGKKRKSEEMEVHEKGNLIRTWNKSSICERKPFEPGFIDNEYVDCSNGLVHSIKKSSVERTHPALYVMATSPTKFSDAPVKFSQGEDLCPPLITKPSTLQECLSFLFLQRPQLCLLQDTLKQLQEDMGMIKNASNPQFQALDGKKHLELENKLILPNHQSLGYVKWLQKVLAYERSKLLLLQTKKDELMKKFQELHFGREEVDRLKCSYLQKQFASNTSGRPVMKARSGAEAEAYIQFLKAEIGKQVEKFSNKKLHMEGRLKGVERENQIAQEKVIKMEQELGILENKVQHMREFYCGFLKVESKTRKQDIAELLRNHVKERSQATVILEDMQLWKLKEMKSKLGENFIELSYSNIISQRFVFERDGRDANILACLSLNHEYIEKVFPFMNASAVFGLVLGSKQSCKIAGVENICQVIQETSFLHGTLIDVLEEVQSCRSRLLNLSFTHFDCINGCGLQLQLKFINDRTGLEARLVLDMSNLLRGVYPSDAFPLEVKILQDTRQPKSMLVVEEVDKEIRVLQTGYPRIKNLSDRVSRLIEKNR